jgi:hypothetical protein
MTYSDEYIARSNVFAEAIESDKLLVKKMEEGNFEPLSEFEERIVNQWLECGNPAVWDFLTSFIKSDFFQDYLKNH